MRVPKDARKVFEGIIFDVYHWDQLLFDGTTKVFEMVKRVPSVEVLAVTGDGMIVMQKEEQPDRGSFISLPAGMGSYDEEPIETARRELREETGMEAEEIILWKEMNLSTKIDWPSYYFIAKGCRKVTKQHLDSGEKIEPYLVTFEEFLEEIEKESFRNFIVRDLFFRLKNTPGELDRFKELLFS